MSKFGAGLIGQALGGVMDLGFGYAGRLLGAKADRKQFAARVRDLRALGISPIAALGGGGMNYSSGGIVPGASGDLGFQASAIAEQQMRQGAREEAGRDRRSAEGLSLERQRLEIDRKDAETRRMAAEADMIRATAITQGRNQARPSGTAANLTPTDPFQQYVPQVGPDGEIVSGVNPQGPGIDQAVYPQANRVIDLADRGARAVLDGPVQYIIRRLYAPEHPAPRDVQRRLYERGLLPRPSYKK